MRNHEQQTHAPNREPAFTETMQIGIVLRDIMFGNRRHFRELVAGSEEGIATNILASRLRQLVAAMMDELRELHLGVPRPDPDSPRPGEQLRAAYEAAVSDGA